MIGRFVAAFLVAGLVAGCAKDDPFKPGSRVLLVASDPDKKFVVSSDGDLNTVSNGTEAVILRPGRANRFECKILGGEWDGKVGDFHHRDMVPAK